MSSIWSAPAKPVRFDVTARELQIGFVLEFGEGLHPDERQPLFEEVVVMLELVEIALHVAVEVALDVALHHRLGIDIDAGAVDAADPLADQCSVDEHPGIVASRIGQTGHVQQPVAQRLLDVGLVLNGIVERHVPRPDQGFDRGDVGVAELAEVDMQARLVAVDGAAE